METIFLAPGKEGDNMRGNNPEKIGKVAAAVLGLIGMVYAGIVGLDIRYVSAGEYRKDIQQIGKSLTRIQVRQLQREAREIEQNSKGKLSENDRERLEAIAEEIRELKESEPKK